MLYNVIPRFTSFFEAALPCQYLFYRLLPASKSLGRNSALVFRFPRPETRLNSFASFRSSYLFTQVERRSYSLPISC